ncbi:MAG TPA: hypothetical protein DIW23_00610 [Anaerolineae bacterium]|nr:hypothetical protein [Anaerolineae bacterium]
MISFLRKFLPNQDLKVAFKNVMEIRMGAPFNGADLELTGSWIPDLPQGGWQDLTACSSDKRYVGLVRWEHLEGSPNFVVYTIDTKRKDFTKADRVAGCCKKIWWDENSQKFEFDRFLYVKTK